MRPKVIAFLGRAGSGKTTAANRVVELFGATKISFATPIKELAKSIMHFTDAQLYGTQAQKAAVDPRYGFSSRQFLQRLGNEARNSIYKDVWLDACINMMKKDGSNLFVIDDCRYVNEATLISQSPQIDGRVVKLTCPDQSVEVDSSHPSEREVDLVEDYVLHDHLVCAKSANAEKLLTSVDRVLAGLKEVKFL